MAREIVIDGQIPTLPPGFNVQEVRVAGNRGACGGVEMTLAAVKQVMEAVPPTVDVWSTNTPVNFPPAFEQYGERLKIADYALSNVPDGSILIVSAHGAPPSLYDQARERDLFVIDTTCPVVLDEQKQVKKAAAAGISIVYLGEKGHPETRGIEGQVKPEEITVFDPSTPIPQDARIPNGAKLFVKTTNDPEKNTQRAQELAVLATIDASRILPCYALKSRYAAGKPLIEGVDFWLVVGDGSSNNANGLRALADARGIPSAIVGKPGQIVWSNFTPEIKIVGVTAAASTPEDFTKKILDTFRQLSVKVVELAQVIPETPRMFRLPKPQLQALKERYS